MPVYTKAEIKAKLDALDLKIGKAEDAQVTTSGGPGQGQHMQRGDLDAMYRERERWIAKWNELDRLETRSSKNLARFPRPQ